MLHEDIGQIESSVPFIMFTIPFGHGFLERVYEMPLVIELRKSGLQVTQQERASRCSMKVNRLGGLLCGHTCKRLDNSGIGKLLKVWKMNTLLNST